VAGILSPAIAGRLARKTGRLSPHIAASVACLLGSANSGLLVRESGKPALV